MPISEVRLTEGKTNLGEHLPEASAPARLWREPDIVLLGDSIVFWTGSQLGRRLIRRHNKILLEGASFFSPGFCLAAYKRSSLRKIRFWGLRVILGSISHGRCSRTNFSEFLWIANRLSCFLSNFGFFFLANFTTSFI